MIEPLARKAAILMGAVTGKYTFTGPDCVLVSITEHCNFSCLNCRFHSSHTHSESRYRPEVKRMPIELVRKLALELKVTKPSVIVISGAGEPLLHPEFKNIVQLLKATGANIKLLTNGSLLNQEKSQFLFDQGIEELRVSVWAKTEEEFQKNYPATDPKYFNKVRENLKHLTQLRKEKPGNIRKLSIHHPINRNNFENLHLLPDLATEWGLDEISFSALIPYPEVDQQSLLTDNDFPALKQSMLALKEQFIQCNIKHNIDQTLFQQEFGAKMVDCVSCYNGWFQLRVQEDGQASPCNTCNIFVGNTHEESIMELWHNPKMQAFREAACTFKGLKGIAKGGFCDYCSSYHINHKIHRIVSRVPFTKAGR